VFSDALIFMHLKIVCVKVESSVTEISESVHWSRCCYAISCISVWNEIVLGSQGTVNQTTSCHVRIEIKHMYPCFIAVIKHGYLFWCV